MNLGCCRRATKLCELESSFETIPKALNVFKVSNEKRCCDVSTMLLNKGIIFKFVNIYRNESSS